MHILTDGDRRVTAEGWRASASFSLLHPLILLNITSSLSSSDDLIIKLSPIIGQYSPQESSPGSSSSSSDEVSTNGCLEILL
ncbi:hypothetical protein Tco_0922163 [Tanacetum coccineum]|uniref:Uncharacterized protein n=1 Tax=Tanacetum coccineum TaxID=301880 RepID=A0ABQ5CY86_9ASTR